MYKGGLGKGEEELLLRLCGQGVAVQRACVVLVENFVVPSATCVLMRIVIVLRGPKAFRNKGLQLCKRITVP